MKRFVVGKGGSSTAPATVRTVDTLRTQDTVEVLLAISEGPIEGLKDGPKTFFVGDTQLENSNGSANFQDFTLETFLGNEVPDEIVTFQLGGAARSTNVNVGLASGVSVVRETLTGDIDFLEVRLAINALYFQDNNGIFTNTLIYRIEYKPHSSATWTKFTGQDITINDKTTSISIEEYRIPVTRLPLDHYDIRVTKISADSDSVSSFTDMSWESFQEVTGGTVQHKDLAMVHLVGQSSDQFSSLPEFSGIWRGRICRVPTNYDPVTRTYDGVWDGTFKQAYTNNNAYVLYDFIENDRYGWSAYSPVLAEPSDIFAAGQWCDVMVPDGHGGLHPRYTFNAYLSEPQSGKDLARYIAGTFNGIVVDDLGGFIRLMVDKDDPAVHLFTPENVENGDFQYSYTDLTTRYNDITVGFSNPDLNYTTDYRRVFNQPDITANGRIPTAFAAVGCVNEQEAIRRAQYKLITSLTECEMVTFRTNRRGQFVQPYDVMLIADPTMGYSVSGRIKSLDESRTVVTLRDPIFFEAGIDYVAHFETPSQGIINRGMTVALGLQTTFTVDSALPDDLPDLAVFSIEQQGGGFGLPKPYRVQSIEQIDGQPDSFEIVGLELNRNKWHDSDNVVSTGTVQFSFLPNPGTIPSPESVTFFATYVRGVRQRQLHVNVTLNKNKYPYFNGVYDVYSKRTTDVSGWQKWTVLNDVIVDHPEGLYDFAVLPKNFFGATLDLNRAQKWTFDVEYNISQLAVVQDFTVTITYAGLEFGWTRNSEPDVDGYEIREGVSWDAGTLLVTDYKGSRFLTPKPKAGSFNYYIAAFTLINGIKNYSSPIAFAIQVANPATVTDFIVVQNQNQIQFTWAQNTEPDIDFYELREGVTWGSGVILGQIRATKFNLPSNINADRSFWIKAVDRAGNESSQAAQAISKLVPTETTNVLVIQDEQATSYSGLKLGATLGAGGIELDQTHQYGEYVHDIDLHATIYARNVITFDFIAVIDDTTSWSTADFAWNSLQAHRTWVATGDIDAVTLNTFIATETSLRSEDIEGFDLNGTLAGVNFTEPAESVDVTYADGRFRQGLKIGPTTQVSWPVAVPASFRTRFWVRPNSLGSDGTIVKFNGAAATSLAIKYQASTQRYYVEDNSGLQLFTDSIGPQVGGPVMIMFVQTPTTRRLHVGDLFSQTTKYAELAVGPVGGFTSLALYDATRADVTISDLLVTTGDTTQAQFPDRMRLSGPPGWSDSVPFIPGDYQYRRAIFRQVMTSAGSDRPLIKNLKLVVDVPDVIDRGVVTIDATGVAEVSFSRRFVSTPEIFPVFKSAPDGAQWSITSVTNTSFVIQVKDALGNLVPAIVAWVAHGF
jgi:predicted phage tail protein